MIARLEEDLSRVTIEKREWESGRVGGGSEQDRSQEANGKALNIPYVGFSYWKKSLPVDRSHKPYPATRCQSW